MGLQAYIDQQLHPERIPDATMEARLAGLTDAADELPRNRPAI